MRTTSEQISELPNSLELHGSFVFADGGTLGVVSEISDSTELGISLPPVKDFGYTGRKPHLNLYLSREHDLNSREFHLIAIRSELESQVIALLKNSTINYRYTRSDLRACEFYGYPVNEISTDTKKFNNDTIRKYRNKIVAFVESDEYLIHNLTAGEEQ